MLAEANNRSDKLYGHNKYVYISQRQKRCKCMYVCIYLILLLNIQSTPNKQRMENKVKKIQITSLLHFYNSIIGVASLLALQDMQIDDMTYIHTFLRCRVKATKENSTR